jgi:hypothetical protein
VKTKPFIIFGAVAALSIACIISLIPNFRHRSELNRTMRALQSLPRDRVYAALELFVRDQKANGRAVPGAASLRELVASGTLRADEAAPFSGMDVTFSTGVDGTHPQQILARVPLPSGGMVALLADGSAAVLTASAAAVELGRSTK